jgi:hypothetical protein
LEEKIKKKPGPKNSWLSGKTDTVRMALSLIPRILTIARALDGRKPEDVDVNITYKDEE